MKERNNEWDYVIDRIDEMRSQAQTNCDAEREEKARLLLMRVKDHDVDSSGRFVSASHSPTCAVCASMFPCSTLKFEAQRWRDRDDFPKHLL